MKTDIEDRLIRFSVRAYKLTEKISKTDYTANLSNQLIRSVTSAALNYNNNNINDV